MAAKRSGILAAGNFIVDHVKVIDGWPARDGLARILSETRHNGGGPYNVLKDLARLGAQYPLQACGLVGADANGMWVVDDCAANGIDTHRIRRTEEAPTSFSDVMTERDTGRRTFFHASGANSLFAPADISFDTNAQFFYLGYLLLLDQFDRLDADGRAAAAGVMDRARHEGMTTVLDCVSENSDRFRSVIAGVLPSVDLLFANDFEAEKLTGVSLRPSGGLDRTAVKKALRALIEFGVQKLACVHFPEGACAMDSDGTLWWQPAVALPQESIAGASGAGDAFAAGVLHAWHGGLPLGSALELGVCTAAASLRHPSCSGAVDNAAVCRALGETYGYRRLPD